MNPWDKRAADAIRIVRDAAIARGFVYGPSRPVMSPLEHDLARVDPHLDHSTYFVYSAGRIKIGFTSGPAEKRVDRLESTIPIHAWLVKVIPGGRITEFKMHHRFAACKIDGWHEWFALSDDLRSYLSEGPADRMRLEGAEQAYRGWLKSELARLEGTK